VRLTVNSNTVRAQFNLFSKSSYWKPNRFHTKHKDGNFPYLHKSGNISSVYGLFNDTLSSVYVTVNPRPARGICSLKAARSVNPRWTNLILHGINVDTGTRTWKVKVNKHKN
jgi:hypothetical protein